LLNPKVALFYLTFLPQFISAHDPVLAKALFLAGIHITLGITWLTGYSYMLGRLSALLMRAQVRKRLEQVTGALLIILGVRLLWERR
jgi:threonine/homoserine/homoserine lactone efflux protein